MSAFGRMKQKSMRVDHTNASGITQDHLIQFQFILAEIVKYFFIGGHYVNPHLEKDALTVLQLYTKQKSIVSTPHPFSTQQESLNVDYFQPISEILLEQFEDSKVPTSRPNLTSSPLNTLIASPEPRVLNIQMITTRNTNKHEKTQTIFSVSTAGHHII